ncbi:MAG: hypothetical protein HY721_05970 [Planctomycetes bacterium]|nr:hypothetical protein [Planctomycetota bacterium]
MSPMADADSRAGDLLLTPAQMESDLEQLVAVLGRAWAYAQDKREHFGVDLGSLLEEHRALIEGTRPRRQFLHIVALLVAALRDGHAWATIPGVPLFPRRRLPFQLVDTVDGLIVERVAPAAAPRPAVGDRLLAAGGRAIEDLVAEASLRAPASTDGMRRRAAIASLHFTEASRFEATFEPPAGPPYDVAPDTLASGDWAEPERPWIEWRRLEPTVGYVRIRSFAAANQREFLAARPGRRERMVAAQRSEIARAFAELDSTDALILDLRGNCGGTDWLGETVAKHLLAPGSTYFRLETHASPDLAALPDFSGPGLAGWLRAIPAIALAVWRGLFPSAGGDVRPDLPGAPYAPPRDPAVRSYAGRPVVIVDAGCFSATDNLLACLADQHPRIRFVGRPTGGGTGAPRTIVTLRHSRIEVTFCVMRVYRPRGDLIEGRGTKPHVTVAWSRRDVLEGRDPDLEAALREARADPVA